MQWKQFVRSVIFGALLVTSTGFAQEFVGIHCGSDTAYISPRGDVFEADLPYCADRGFGYVGGETPSSYLYELVGGREDTEWLYRRVREGEFEYRFDLPNGLYAVKLFLGDLIMHGPEFRSMFVIAEGDTIIEGLDLCAEVGHAFAYPVRFAVEIEDGQLNLEFGSTLGGAICSAIAARAVEEDSEPPITPVWFTPISGYEMNILYWDFNTEEDLGGYRVYRKSGGDDWQLVSGDSHPLYRFFDYNVDVGDEYEYRATAVDLWGNESAPTSVVTATAIDNSSTSLTRMEIFVGDESLHELNSAYWSEEYVDADLVAGGETFANSGMRFRGNYSRNLSKKSYKIKLPDGRSLDGRDRINLSSEMVDYTMLKNRIAWRAYDQLTELNSRIQNVHLEINGKYRGVYLDMEEVDDNFLLERGLSTAGNIYKAESGLWALDDYEEYQEHYVKQNNEESDWSDIIEFTTWLDTSSAGQFLCKAGHRFDVDQALNMYVGLIATADQDCGGHNYYLYHNPVNRKWSFIPWDHNTSLKNVESPINLYTSECPSPIAGYTNLLWERLLQEPFYRYAYCKKLERFLERDFTVELMRVRIQTAFDSIYFDAERDIYKNGWERRLNLLYGRDALNIFFTERASYLLGEIPGFISNPDRALAFRLNEAMTVNHSTIQDEHGDYDPWVEVANISPVEMDLSGFTLSFGDDSWALSDDAVVPAAGRILLWLDGEPGEGPNHASFIPANSGGVLKLKSEQGTKSDSTMVPVLDENMAWARLWDNWGEWRNDLEPTPGEANSPPADPSPLRINELLAINNYSLPDEQGEYEDWIEIYNPADYAIPLVGLFLSDNADQLSTWAFPDTTIQPGGYIVVWCDEEPGEGPLHATFRLSNGGESIFLTDRDCTTPIDNMQYAAQIPDRSWGRYPDGDSQWARLAPSPGLPNVWMAVDEGIEQTPPESFALYQNYPNPFNPSTTIRFDLPERAQVRIKIYDITGRQVEELINREMNAGEHQAFWNAENNSTGIYFYRMQAGTFTDVKKLAVIK